MSFFMESVLKGITPNNLIFNIDKDGNIICLDGKQRISSLVKFKNNEIPATLSKEDTDGTKQEKIEYVYYSKIPNEHKNDEKCRVLEQKERNDFNNAKIPTVTYKNLAYEEQVDIFYRIQHGMVLSPGEKISSLFTSDNVTKYFNEYCKQKEDLFKKFVGYNDRKEQNIKIAYIMYMTSKNTPKIPNKKDRETYIKSFIPIPFFICRNFQIFF